MGFDNCPKCNKPPKFCSCWVHCHTRVCKGKKRILKRQEWFAQPRVTIIKDERIWSTICHFSRPCARQNRRRCA